jgi:hypothetical protein
MSVTLSRGVRYANKKERRGSRRPPTTFVQGLVSDCGNLEIADDSVSGESLFAFCGLATNDPRLHLADAPGRGRERFKPSFQICHRRHLIISLNHFQSYHILQQLSVSTGFS